MPSSWRHKLEMSLNKKIWALPFYLSTHLHTREMKIDVKLLLQIFFSSFACLHVNKEKNTVAIVTFLRIPIKKKMSKLFHVFNFSFIYEIFHRKLLNFHVKNLGWIHFYSSDIESVAWRTEKKNWMKTSGNVLYNSSWKLN